MSANLASLFNLTGLAVVLAASLLVLRNYNNGFFQHWTRAFGAASAMTALEAISSCWGRPLPSQCVEVALCLTSTWYYQQTSAALQQRQLPRRLYGWGMSLGLLLALGMIARGAPFTLVSTPPLLLLSASIAYLGFVLVRRGKAPDDGFNAAWLGTPLLALGAMPLLFPLVLNTPWMWLGYWLAGFLNLTTGVGMLIFVVEGTSAQLRRQNHELRAVDQMKNDFLSMVSHELRTPLTVIKGGVAIMRESPLSETDVASLLASVAGSADQLHRLIDDLLDFSRMELGKLAYEMEPCDLGQLTRDVAQDFKNMSRAETVQFEVDVPDAELVASLDPRRIMQVQLNLLTNALKFTPAGGRITLRLEARASSALIVVSDTGPGVPSAYRERVFERFFQAERGDTRNVTGVGLGLAICKAIVEAHGGRIWLDSHSEPGATFCCELPLQGVTPTPPVAYAGTRAR
ncbi:MAG TPA: HAMP domain-containing sensor histidine kinase [Oscillatoriaceae cyanobacterium]